MSTSALVVNIAVSILSGAPEQKIIQEFEEANNMRELFFRAGTGKMDCTGKNTISLKKVLQSRRISCILASAVT